MSFDSSGFFNEASLVGMMLCSLLLLVGHWFPWSKIIGRKLPRLGAYVYGVVCIWLGFFVWRYSGHQDWQTPAALLALAAVGGASVFLAYLIDFLSVWLDTSRRRGRDER